MKKAIISLSIMFTVMLGTLFAFSSVMAYDDTVVTDKVSFNGGGSCTLSATFRRLSSGSVTTLQQKYIKSPKSGYTIYTTDIKTTKNSSNRKIFVTGSCAQAKSAPSSSSYVKLEVSHPY